jgi:hypothetical protein
MADQTKRQGVASTATKAKPVLSKMGAVRKAMAKLGWSSGRSEIRDYVRTQFGIDMTADHVSTCRAEILRKRGAKSKSSAPKASTAKAQAAKNGPTATAVQAKLPATPAKASSPAAKGIRMEDVLAVKDLVGRVGASHLKTLVDAFTG